MKSLTDLTATEFENLTFDLVQAIGLRNCIWRTPGRDGGRDIQGEWTVQDLSGFTRSETWYVECKRYKDSVSWPTVWEKIAFSEVNLADTLLIVTTSSLSPQAIDEVNKWNKAAKRPIIRFWGGHDILPRLQLQPAVAIKYGLSKHPSSDAAIAILPLTQMLLRYAHAAEAEQLFSGSASRAMSVVYALSEFISVTLESIENRAEYHPSSFRADIDGYPWIKNVEHLQSVGFDRYAVRVVLSMIWFYTGSQIILELRGNVVFAKIEKIIPEALRGELQIIAQWGHLVLRQDIPAMEVSIEKQRE